MAREPICSQPCCKVAAQLIGHQGTTTLFRGLPAFFLPHCFWEASTPPPHQVPVFFRPPLSHSNFGFTQGSQQRPPPAPNPKNNTW